MKCAGRRLPALCRLGAGNCSFVCCASLVNPYGYRLHIHVYRYLSSRWLMNHIDEFLSPDFHGVAQQCFVLILLITIVGLAMGGSFRWRDYSWAFSRSTAGCTRPAAFRFRRCCSPW